MLGEIKTGECTKCWVWGMAPLEFDERKHFLVCPNCNGNMFLKYHAERINNKGTNLEDVMRPSKQVTITELRKHKGK